MNQILSTNSVKYIYVLILIIFISCVQSTIDTTTFPIEYKITTYIGTTGFFRLTYYDESNIMNVFYNNLKSNQSVSSDSLFTAVISFIKGAETEISFEEQQKNRELYFQYERTHNSDPFSGLNNPYKSYLHYTKDIHLFLNYYLISPKGDTSRINDFSFSNSNTQTEVFGDMAANLSEDGKVIYQLATRLTSSFPHRILRDINYYYTHGKFRGK